MSLIMEEQEKQEQLKKTNPEAYYWANGIDVLLAGDVARQYAIKPNSLAKACNDRLVDAFQPEGSKYWRIAFTPKSKEWLEGYRYRAGRGQGPKPMSLQQQALKEIAHLFDRLRERAAQDLSDPNQRLEFDNHLEAAEAVLASAAESNLTNSSNNESGAK